MKIRLVEDGNFSQWARTILLVAGLSLMIIACIYIPAAPFGGFLLLLGFGIAAVGGLSSRAHLLNIRPFGNNNAKSRRTYEKKSNGKNQS